MVPTPEFPPPFVVERTRSLGFGTGPWRREQLVERWGAPMADKFIAAAKAAGWLISPDRGVYYVPAAQDLMAVSWLSGPARSEWLASRALATASIPYWCLSVWCRDRGLDLGAPIFVTDLGVGSTVKPAGNAPLDRRALRAAAQAAAGRVSSLPFADVLVVVPLMPKPSAEPQLRTVLVPEEPSIESQREVERTVGTAAVALVALGVWALTKGPPPGIGDAMVGFEERETRARGIRYAVGPRIDDEAWIVALLASLGTARIEELVARWRKDRDFPSGADIQRWAGLMGPPQPNRDWKETIQDGPFPYLLVPPPLWTEMGADQAARRFRMLERPGGG